MAAGAGPGHLEMLGAIVDRLPGMVYRRRNDRHWTTTYVSPGCVELTGYRCEDLIGNRRAVYAELIHPDDRARVWDEVQAGIESGRPFWMEYRIITASGEERRVFEHGCALGEGAPVRELIGYVGALPPPHGREHEASEARFRRFYESVSAGVVVRDAELAIVYANRAASELLGQHVVEGSRTPWGGGGLKAISEDGTPMPIEAAPSAVALRTGKPVRGVVMGLPLGPGQPRWLLVNAEPALDSATGRVREVITTFIDITEQRRAEQDLQYRLAFESLISRLSSDLLSLKNTELDSGILRALQAIGEFADVDRAYVFQLRPDGCLMDNTHEWCAPGISTQIHRLQRLVLDQQFPWLAAKLRRLEIVHVPRVRELPDAASAERSEFELEEIKSIVLVPMVWQSTLSGFLGFDAVRAEKTWSADGIVLLQLVGEMISGALERQRGEQALRDSEDRFRSLFHNLTDVVLVVDAFGRLRFETPSIHRLLGLSPARLEEAELRELVAPEDHKILEAMLAHVVESHGEVRRELRCLRADGSRVECEVLATNLLDNAAISGLVLTVRDISERRRVEEERRRLELQLQQTQRLESLGILAGGVAHDFNNLLTGVIGEAGIALAALPPDSPARDSVQRMEQAAVRAAELTQQLLAYSGKGRLSRQRVQLRNLVEEMVGLLQISVSRRAALEYRFAPQLADVLADVAQLRQVIMNLILNAAEACTRGGLIQLSTGGGHLARSELDGCLLGEELEEGEYVWLEVKDNGGGMSQEVTARMFEPFFTTKFTGRGLGLAAVLGIVRGHGGALRVESRPGEGTCFRVVLPAHLAEQPAAAPPREVAVAAADEIAPDRPARRTVLVVDDDSTVRLLAQNVLERAGYKVLVAVDGPPALDLFRERAAEIGLVLLDMTMPHMRGEEVLEALRQIRQDVAVLISSGYHESETVEQVGSHHEGFLQKPYTAEQLLRAAGQAVARARRGRAG